MDTSKRILPVVLLLFVVRTVQSVPRRPDICSRVRCAYPICPNGEEPTTPAGQCCPVCRPTGKSFLTVFSFKCYLFTINIRYNTWWSQLKQGNRLHCPVITIFIFIVTTKTAQAFVCIISGCSRTTLKLKYIMT